jgi:hypothetical protein
MLLRASGCDLPEVQIQLIFQYLTESYLKFLFLLEILF